MLSDRLDAAFATELRAMPGIEAAFERIACPVCVASSSDPRRIERSLRLTGLFSRFHPHLYSAKHVARGKPAPDLFLHAAAQMHADPRACVVIEDSIAGVTAGAAAGMNVIGFTAGSHCPSGHGATLRQAGAATICGRAEELPGAIGAC
jgi:HAD superfamily hydrolase (TIGR01509 family)